jgi:hypothetical protein
MDTKAYALFAELITTLLVATGAVVTLTCSTDRMMAHGEASRVA